MLTKKQTAEAASDNTDNESDENASMERHYKCKMTRRMRNKRNRLKALVSLRPTAYGL
jgi:hypothetical protein